MNEEEADNVKRFSTTPWGRAFAVRTAAVAVFDALAIAAIAGFVSNQAWVPAAMFVAVIIAVNWAYLHPRANASPWLTPGLVMMAIFVVYPVIYTAYVSVTNWQTGNVLTRDQAIENLLDKELPREQGETGELAVYAQGGDLVFFVQGDTVDPFAGTPRLIGSTSPTQPIDLGSSVAGPPDQLDGYERVSGLALTAFASQLEELELLLPDGRIASVATLQSFRVAGGPRFSYDETADVVTDALHDLRCPAGEGTFYCNDVPGSLVSASARAGRDTTISCSADTCDNVPLFAIDPSLPGWREVIGFDNYESLVQNERIRTPLLRVLVWNIAFALLSVLFTFGLGLALALALQDEGMRGRSIYRSIFILPYAIPAFLSVLVWRGLLNTDIGKINDLLETIGLSRIDWLGDNGAAMVAVLVVNLWLGFPYMFLVCSGAVTSIPGELIEAAQVDGAGPWRRFRMITLPLLLVSTAPLLIGSFAFNFNNFVLIFLLTDGGPPLTGYDVPVGATDILISFTFNLAGSSGRGNQFGLATAIIVVIFLFLAVTSALSFRLTKQLEETYAG